MREGSVDAPTRHPIEWKTEAFWDRDSLNGELTIERVTVPKRFRFPFYRVTSGCIDATFAHVLLPLFKVV